MFGIKVARLIAMTGLVIASLTLSVTAQNISNLSPYRSFMKSANTGLTVGTSLVSGFGATTVTLKCPRLLYHFRC
jgi:flagellar hook-associated protein FlgK